MSQRVVDMAAAQADQVAIESNIKDVEKPKDSLLVLDMSSAESLKQ